MVVSKLGSSPQAMPNQAGDHYQQSLDALFQLGANYASSGQLDLAADVYRKLLALDRHNIQGWANLIQILMQDNRADIADAELASAGTRGLDPFFVAMTNALVLPIIYENTDHIRRWRNRISTALTQIAHQRSRTSTGILIKIPTHFRLGYQGFDDRLHMTRIAEIFRSACPELVFHAPHIDAWREPEGRIHLGIYSANLKSHTVGKLNFGLVKYIDRNRFKLTLFVPKCPGDKFAEQFRLCAEQVIDIPDDLEGARNAVAQQRLDALLFPDIGMDPLTSLVAHARLAPLQMTSWGHPVTSGIPTIDEFLSSELIETADAQTHYSEHLIRFKHLPSCYQRYMLPPLKSANTLGLSSNRHYYFCPQSLFKLHPNMDSAFRDILDRDPKGEILLLSGSAKSWNQAILTRLQRSLGQLITRIKFLPRMGLTDFLSVLNAVDVVLDSFPFGGGNTHYDALMIGASMVTWPHGYMRGRVGAGCLKQINVTDLLAENSAEYVDLAIRAANDTDFRLSIRKRILEQGDKLYHDTGWIRDFENHIENSLETKAQT